VIYHYW